MKTTTIVLIFAIFLFSLVGCSSKYSADNCIGKTSAQIEAEYGTFDCCGMPASEDGLYRDTACGYTVKESRVGFLGTDPEWLVFIQFDENSIAYNTYVRYRPGG